MNVQIVTPVPAYSRQGNRVTAARWARILRALGHRVSVLQEYDGRGCDVLVALHARKSYHSIQQFNQNHPDRPLILALTGTDLYGDIRTHRRAQASLELAWRLVVLQPNGIEELPKRHKSKAHVIYQSVAPPRTPSTPRRDIFEVCVLGHLRPVKDPFRTAFAARQLPASSTVRITHVGAALSTSMQRRARLEAIRNPRYRWLGEQPRWKAMRVLARSRLMVLTSKMEGGANAISEALAATVPILSSRIGGSIGLLGENYSGYFPVGDTSWFLSRKLFSVMNWSAVRVPISTPSPRSRHRLHLHQAARHKGLYPWGHQGPNYPDAPLYRRGTHPGQPHQT